MNIKINPMEINGEISAISSKSHVHRLLIGAALAENSCEIYFNKLSKDIEATANCLKAMGAEIIYENNKFKINPIKKIENNVILPCGESGSTLRFLLPVIGALGISGDFKTEGKLSSRPISPLKEELIKKGMIITCNKDIIHGEKQICSGKYILPGNISSQFITGLLFALPLLKNDSKIIITTDVQSQGYIDLTINVLKEFGINIEFKDNTFYIKGNQKYHAPEKIYAEGDWSNSAFWLTMGALSEKGITCNGLNLNSLQGDKAILDILKKFGAHIKIENNTITVKSNKLYGNKFNCSQIPDIAPEIAILGVFAEGKTEVFGAERLRLKECDRIKAICTCLKNLGADIIEKSDGFIINSVKNLKGGKVNSFNDHRIAMMCAISAIKSENPIIIENAEAINKSYPDFYKDYIKLGGKIEKEV